MVKGYFDIKAIWLDRVQSAESIALSVVSLFHELALYSQAFRWCNVYESQKKFITVDFINSDEETRLSIAKAILNSNLNDIRQFDKVKHPNVDFSRNYGFSFLLVFKNDKKEYFSFYCQFGSDEINCIRTLTFSTDAEFALDWYFTVNKSFVRYFNPLYSSIAPKGLHSKIDKPIYYPIGWITYYDNYFAIHEQLRNLLINEPIGNGLIYYFTKDNFTLDKNVTLQKRQEMAELTNRFKDYLQRETTK